MAKRLIKLRRLILCLIVLNLVYYPVLYASCPGNCSRSNDLPPSPQPCTTCNQPSPMPVVEEKMPEKPQKPRAIKSKPQHCIVKPRGKSSNLPNANGSQALPPKIGSSKNRGFERGLRNAVRLSPKIRAEPLTGVTQKELASLRAFLSDSIVLNCCEFSCLPYILDFEDNRVFADPGTRIYVRKLPASCGGQYTLFKGKKTYCDPETCEILGYEAEVVGQARMEKPETCNCTAVLRIEAASEPIEQYARVAAYQSPEVEFKATLPTVQAAGYILSVREGMHYTGRNQVVVLSIGERDGIVEGNILDAYSANRRIRDDKYELCYCPFEPQEVVRIPEHKLGKLWVFRTFEKLSLALVLEANSIIKVNDRVYTPN